MLSKLKNTFVPITDLSEWVRHSFCPLRAPTFRYYESSSRPYGKVISPNGLNGVPQAAKRSLPTERPFSPDQTRHLCRTTSHSPLTHGISPPPAIVLSSLMVLSIMASLFSFWRRSTLRKMATLGSQFPPCFVFAVDRAPFALRFHDEASLHREDMFCI